MELQLAAYNLAAAGEVAITTVLAAFFQLTLWGIFLCVYLSVCQHETSGATSSTLLYQLLTHLIFSSCLLLVLVDGHRCR